MVWFPPLEAYFIFGFVAYLLLLLIYFCLAYVRCMLHQILLLLLLLLLD